MFPALTRLRDEGVIHARSMGVNCPQLVRRCLDVADRDIHLLARRYSLIDHVHAAEQLLPAARNKDVGFMMASALNAGLLRGAPRYNDGASGRQRCAAWRASTASTWLPPRCTSASRPTLPDR